MKHKLVGVDEPRLGMHQAFDFDSDTLEKQSSLILARIELAILSAAERFLALVYVHDSFDHIGGRFSFFT